MSLADLKSRFSVEKAHKAQLQLSKRIIFEDGLSKKIGYVAGVDVAYAKNLAISAVVVLEYDVLELVEAQTAICKVAFPYIPTLLSFRELPPTLMCIRKLKVQPDVFLVDGQGYAHPYRCGFASHLGVVLGKPTIGVAKSRLVGEAEPFGNRDFAYLWHDGEIVGAALKTSVGKALYVSVGHMVSLETAIKIVRHCARYSGVPEPLRMAHEMATAERNKIRF
ncbi:endonuclease V [Candidatus Bathyarchaeota archaeon]|nr:endonuclease V [Candidatus Bathyarchaeota archaeon]